MKRKTHREIEAYYFEQFSETYKLPQGKINYSDRPDVIIRGKRKIGVEVTNFYLEDGRLPECEQSQVIKRTKAVKRAHKLFLERVGKNYNVTFGFDKKHPVHGVDRLADELARLITHVKLPQKGELPGDRYSHIPELAYVYFDDREYAKPRWRINQVYDVPLMSLKNLRKIIRKKELKAKNYAPCDALWLLVVVDLIDPAQDQEIEIEGLDTIGSSIFEKVIVYKTYFEKVIEIDCS